MTAHTTMSLLKRLRGNFKMAKLKTLKDFGECYETGCCKNYFIKELREEAIKWLKVDDFEIMRVLRQNKQHPHSCPISVRAFVKYFFNIKESDLK